MLSWSRRGTVALALAAGATVLSGCSGSSPAPQDGGEGGDLSGPLVGTDVDLVPLDFAEVTTEHCVGHYLLSADGRVQTVDCARPGAAEVVAVTRFGEAAEGVDGTEPVAVDRAAGEVCGPLIAGAGGPELALQLHMYPLSWQGPETPLVCAVQVPPAS